MKKKVIKVQAPPPTRERFERMAWRVAHLQDIHRGAVEYSELPEKVRALFDTMSYDQLIRPLVKHDRSVKQLTLMQIANAYGISYNKVIRILSKKPCC